MIKLLIVDDEPLVQIGIKSMINWEEYGIEVCGTAMNGANALDLIEEYSPEIVITDIRMPIMNGLELAKTCREKYSSLHLSDQLRGISADQGGHDLRGRRLLNQAGTER